MNGQLKALFGSWEQAIGTLLSAISSTPTSHLNQTVQKNLDLLGNVMQATGNALIADSTKQISLNKIGNQIQAIGNSTVIVGLIIQFNKTTTNTKLDIQGNLLQAIGSGMSLPDLLNENNVSSKDVYLLLASLLQLIGNALQALGSIRELKKQDGQNINFVGSWIQAIGASIQAFAS